MRKIVNYEQMKRERKLFFRCVLIEKKVKKKKNKDVIKTKVI